MTTYTYEPHGGTIEFSSHPITAIKYQGETFLSITGTAAALRAMADEAEPTPLNGASCLRAAARLIEGGQ